jgi:isocitrate lyase
MQLAPSPLLPEGFQVPTSRWTNPSARLRQLLASEPYVFAPGVYDPYSAELSMYYGFPAVYFSGYSFAMGHLGSTDMDLYSATEIADGARRTVSALRKFQLTMAVGDPEAGVGPRHLHVPPLVCDMDGGYGNAFNVQRATELYVQAGVAAAHLEDQVLPKRCGHIAGKALIGADEMLGKLRAARSVADDLGNPEFVLIARTDAVSAVEAPEETRGLRLAIERALRYLDSGLPDLMWCEFPDAARGPTEQFAVQVKKRFPEARLAYNYSSSFRWDRQAEPIGFAELGDLGYRFIFITLAAIHAGGLGLSELLRDLSQRDERAYASLQQREHAPGQDLPSQSHHRFSGVPYHHLMGEVYAAARLSRDVQNGHRSPLAV